MKICSICKREAHGFAFIKPPLRASDPRNRKMMKHFCSRNCQEIFTNRQIKNSMIDLTKLEKEAIESALIPVGEYVAEIGMNKPLAEYSREEVLCLIEVALSSYFDFMQGKVDDSEVLPC
jgi:hypothetical protein